MMDKKALGLHWYIAALAFIISMGILAWGNINTKIPLVGQFSAATAHALENGNNIPIEVEAIMNQLNTEASISYENHKVFALDSYCSDAFDGDKDGITQENTKYKDRLLAAKPNFNTPKIGELNHFTTRNNVKCYAAEEEFMKYYEEAFNLEYKYFKSTKWENLNLDFSSVDYSSEVVMEFDMVKKYFNLLKTTNGFTIPMTLQDKKGAKNIGSFNVKPNFKLETPNPTNRPFDGHEACIFAADCGANCHDVIERNPGSNFKLMENAVPASHCEAYYDCTTPLDQFGKRFSCSKESPSDSNNPILCRGQCLPFCSIKVPTHVTDDALAQDPAASETICKQFSCTNYVSCNSVSSCGCEATDPNSCLGNCNPPYCTTPAAFIVNNKATQCKSQSCDWYDDLNGHSCSSISYCACTSENSCEGDCSCESSTMDLGCSGLLRGTRTYYPNGCQKPETDSWVCGEGCATFCECNPCACDPCGCNYPPACDCSGKSCCTTDTSLCPPTPPPCVGDDCPPPPGGGGDGKN